LVTLSNGETHQIRHPENVIVIKTRLILGYPETDWLVHVSLLNVNRIQPVQPVG